MGDALGINIPMKILESRSIPQLTIVCYNDANNNSYNDDLETGVQGKLFLIEGLNNSTVQLTAVTDKNGEISLSLPPGEYDIEELVESMNKSTNISPLYPKIRVVLFPGDGIKYYLSNSNGTYLYTSGIDSGQLVEGPQIELTPSDLVFSETDWQFEHGKRIYISIYNPNNCNINNANIKLTVPIGWSIIPNVDSSLIYYISNESTVYVSNFGNYYENYTADWVEIKPDKNALPKNYQLSVEINVSFVSRSSTYDVPLLQMAKTTKSINLTLVKTSKVSGILDTIKQNISFICTIILVVLGPGLYYRYSKKPEK